MRVVWLAVILTASMVYGEKSKPHTDADRHKATDAIQQADSTAGGSIIVVNQQAPNGQQEGHPAQPPSYFHELLLPQNVPADALVLVGIAGIVTALYTLKVLSRQALSMRRQTTLLRRSVLWARKSAKAAKESADAALLNAQAVIDAERAWIMVDLKLRDKGVWQADSADGRITLADVNLICSNEGRSVAWVIEKVLVFKIVKSLPQEPDFSEPMDVFVNEPEPLVPSPSAKSYSVTQLQPWIHGWRGENGNLVTIYGFVKYRDIFGETRETRYGYSINIDYKLERLVGYPEYNRNDR